MGAALPASTLAAFVGAPDRARDVPRLDGTRHGFNVLRVHGAFRPCGDETPDTAYRNEATVILQLEIEHAPTGQLGSC